MSQSYEDGTRKKLSIYHLHREIDEMRVLRDGKHDEKYRIENRALRNITRRNRLK